MEQLKKYSFIHNLEEFIKEQGIPFKRIPMPMRLFDKTVNHCVKSKLVASDENIYNHKLGKWFYACFDDENNIYLEFKNHTTGKLLYVMPDDTKLSGTHLGVKLPESIFCDIIEELQQKELEVVLEKKPCMKRFLNSNEEIYGVEYYLNDCLSNIYDYLKYLKDEYEETIKPQSSTIMFKEPDPVPIQRIGRPGKKSRARVHEPIDVYERLEVLNAAHPTNEVIAVGSNKREIYYVYAYKFPETNGAHYRIIMEPEAGTTYTKIVFLNSTMVMSQADVESISKHYLEMSRKETNKHPYVYRASHWTLDRYKKTIGYVLGNEGIEPDQTTGRIDQVQKNVATYESTMIRTLKREG